MDGSQQVLLFIAGFGILQSFLLAAILYFHPKGDRSVTFFLSLYIICLCLPMFMPVVERFSSWHKIIFIEPVTLLLGPLLYLYVRSFKERITWKKAWPHFILYAATMVLMAFMHKRFITLYPDAPNVPEEVIKSPIAVVRSFIRMSQMLIYYFLARHALKRYQQSVEQLYSETSRISMHWVRWLINGYIVLFAIMVVFYFLILRYPDQFILLLLFHIAIVSPYIWLVAFKGLTQPTLWQLHPETSRTKIEDDLHQAEVVVEEREKASTKVQPPITLSDKSSRLVERTITLMEKERLYQESELSLQDLADKLQTPAYLVSQAINEGLNKNFYDLVNGYRVEAAKKLLADPSNQHYKILSVGFEAGFNSKTTFNTVFKKFTGLSPSDYRHQNSV